MWKKSNAPCQSQTWSTQSRCNGFQCIDKKNPKNKQKKSLIHSAVGHYKLKTKETEGTDCTGSQLSASGTSSM